MKMFPSLFSSRSWRSYWMHLRHYGIAILIFLLGVFLSFATFRFYQAQDLRRTQAEFDRIADLRLFLIKEILLETAEQIESIKQFFYASDDITAKDFHIFVRNSFKFYPNLLVLGWKEVKPSLYAWLKPRVSLDFVDLAKLPFSAPSYRFPFTYLEKANSSQPFIVDAAKYSEFVNLLYNSRQLQTLVVSTTFSFFRKEEKTGFFLFNSVVFENMEHPVQPQGVFGTIVGFSNFDDIVQNARSPVEPLGIHLSIYNVSGGDQQLLYRKEATILKDPPDLTPHQRQLQEQWERSHIFQFGNRTWKLMAAPTLGFIHQHQHQSWNYWEVLIIGILISGLTASYFLVLVNRRMSIEQEVMQRTNELATINSILQQEIHERQRMEEEFTKNQRYLERRHEALEYLTKLTTSELRTAINEVILRTASVLEADRVSIWFYETNGNTQILSCTGLYILSTHSFSNHLEFNSTHFPHYFNALSTHTHLVFPSAHDAEVNQELSSYLAAFHITSKLDIPIVFEGNLLGVLSCEETRGHRVWLLEDRHFGQTIADIIAIMIEQSARRKAEKALQESDERLRFITQKAVDGILSVDDKEQVISWNFGAEQMFGYSETEIMKKQLPMILPQDGFFLKDEKSSHSIELKGRHKDGHLFPIEISHTHWKSGELFFDTLIVRDITARKEYEKRLIKAIREAKAANEAKNEFLATISHELRTPLNAIIGFNECLLMGLDGSINKEQTTSLKKIEKSSFNLLHLINDILDLAKIEAKKMELEVLPYNIVEIISSCVEEMQSLAKRKNLELQLVMNQSFILIEIDKVRIRQVMLNLLSNAIKFTEKGSITVSILNELDQIRLLVKDTGIGLSQEEIAKIFYPFSQADSSITRKYGGTGLGLAISKNIIDLHGGTITVESQKGIESTFIVTLPKTKSTI